MHCVASVIGQSRDFLTKDGDAFALGDIRQLLAATFSTPG